MKMDNKMHEKGLYEGANGGIMKNDTMLTKLAYKTRTIFEKMSARENKKKKI